LWTYSAELWTKNSYKSCNLPSVDDDDDSQDDNVDDDDDVKTMNINYVIGDVLQPQNTDDTDAVIVHCVGNEHLITVIQLIIEVLLLSTALVIKLLSQ